jgi:hypothetical protein
LKTEILEEFLENNTLVYKKQKLFLKNLKIFQFVIFISYTNVYNTYASPLHEKDEPCNTTRRTF